jgi:hypothetical protein
MVASIGLPPLSPVLSATHWPGALGLSGPGSLSCTALALDSVAASRRAFHPVEWTRVVASGANLTCGGAQRASVTAHVPGVHESEIELEPTLPVQLCGPWRLMLPSELTVPVKLSNGAANDSAQLASETTAVMPTSDASQCFATVQLPETSGHAPPPEPALSGESDDPELHAHARSNATNTRLPIIEKPTATRPWKKERMQRSGQRPECGPKWECNDLTVLPGAPAAEQTSRSTTRGWSTPTLETTRFACLPTATCASLLATKQGPTASPFTRPAKGSSGPIVRQAPSCCSTMVVKVGGPRGCLRQLTPARGRQTVTDDHVSSLPTSRARRAALTAARQRGAQSPHAVTRAFGLPGGERAPVRIAWRHLHAVTAVARGR